MKPKKYTTFSQIKDKNEYLKQLCTPLNVDLTPDEIKEEHAELSEKIDQIEEEKTTLESDLGDYKESYDNLNEKLDDFHDWMKALYSELEDPDNKEVWTPERVLDSVLSELTKARRL